jgi:1-acyl-sn-glycerol-3-phosphate acyltransferase
MHRAASAPGGAIFAAAIKALGFMARYSRFETSGVEHLLEGEPGVLVGYHGRPHALDYFYLCALMHDRFGTFPKAIVRSSLQRTPLARDLMRQAGLYYGAPGEGEIARLRERREHLYVSPGGLREALRPFWKDRYRVSWGSRRGYIRLAARHHLPIYPCAAIGVDEAYLGLHDGHALAKRLGISIGPLWLAVGMGGPWPLALPFPVRIVQRIGAPIDLAPLRAQATSDERFEHDAHELVQGRVQRMLDDLLHERRARRRKGGVRTCPTRAR